jgi:hypothetical protein
MATGVDRGVPTVAASEVRTDDWPAQATDAIVNVVGKAHDTITGPIQKVARAIVWGLFATVLGVTAVVLFVILAIRIVDVYLPESVFGENHVWAAYLIVGLLFSAAGLWGLRQARKTPVAD